MYKSGDFLRGVVLQACRMHLNLSAGLKCLSIYVIGLRSAEMRSMQLQRGVQ